MNRSISLSLDAKWGAHIQAHPEYTFANFLDFPHLCTVVDLTPHEIETLAAIITFAEEQT